MNELYYLAYLVHQKNNINRRRRRFYAMMQSEQIWCPKSRQYIPNQFFNKEEQKYAKDGYEKAKADGKAFMPQVKKVYKELNMKLCWGESGNITGILTGTRRMSIVEVEKLAKEYIAESILLGK